jgi:hypothetical protein
LPDSSSGEKVGAMTTEYDKPESSEPLNRSESAGAPNDMLEAALTYSNRGWRVFPLWECRGGACTCRDSTACSRPGKHPRTSNGVNDATTDESQIRVWWREWSTANVGIATGSAGGIFVVDIDGEKGNTSWAELTKKNFVLPRTPESRTGRGSHLYFRYPASARIGSFSNPDLQIDVRGEGGYVVAPPSVHESGKPYAWVVAPDQAALIDAPEWLIREIETWSTRGSAPAGMADRSRVGAGNRNSHLHVLGSAMRGRGASDGAVRQALLAENQSLDPPLVPTEVGRTIEQVLSYAPGAPVAADPLPDPGFLADVVDAEAFNSLEFQTRPSILGSGLLGQGELAILYGQPGTNKSFLTLYLAVAVATGSAWFGQPTSQTNVGVISLELPGALLRDRIRVVVGTNPMPRTLFPIARESVRGSFDVTNEHVLSRIINFCKERSLGLLILDPLSRIHTRDENAAQEMGAVLNALRRLSLETTTSVLLVHHEGKQSRNHSGSGDLAALRGSARLESDPTLLMRMVRHGPHERGLRFVKSNFAALPEDVFLLEDPATGGLSISERKLRGREQGDANRERVRQAVIAAGKVTLRDLVSRLDLCQNTVRDHLKGLEALYDRSDHSWRLQQEGEAA